MDETWLTQLLRRHAGLIHKIAYAYCRDATDREDIVQEVAVQLWRAQDRYDARFAETTWIYRIALNVAISFHRRERRHRVRVPLEEHPIALEPVAPSADVELLAHCIEELGPLEKALVVLYLDGNDQASIADVLGISISNVGTKLGRIKAKLRTAYERKQTHGSR